MDLWPELDESLLQKQLVSDLTRWSCTGLSTSLSYSHPGQHLLIQQNVCLLFVISFYSLNFGEFHFGR